MTHMIGLAGLMGSGKNEVANMLCDIGGYVEYAFAYKLREEVAEILRTKRIPHDYPPAIIPTAVHYFGKVDKVWEKPTEIGMRKLLQWHGTEYRRRLYGDDYWVKQTFQEIFMLPKVVLTDVRFQNEYDAIKYDGGEVWLVRRSDREHVYNAAHVSEHFVKTLGPHNVDRVIDNDGSLEDLYEKVREALYCCPVAA